MGTNLEVLTQANPPFPKMCRVSSTTARDAGQHLSGFLPNWLQWKLTKDLRVSLSYVKSTVRFVLFSQTLPGFFLQGQQLHSKLETKGNTDHSGMQDGPDHINAPCTGFPAEARARPGDGILQEMLPQDVRNNAFLVLPFFTTLPQCLPYIFLRAPQKAFNDCPVFGVAHN